MLTNFPYLCRYDRSFSGEISEIYEIPMTISDAGQLPMTPENWQERVNLWLSIITKNAANHAPTVLLIHPNREFKLLAEEKLLQTVPDEISIVDMDAFGEYWRKREVLTYETSLTDRVVTITLPAKSMPLDPRLSVIVNEGGLLSEVIVQTDTGGPIQYESSEWTNSNLLLYSFRVSDTPTAVAVPRQPIEDYELLRNYPNPFNPSTTIQFVLQRPGDVSLKIYNLRGQLVATLHQGALVAGRHQMVWDGKDARGLQVTSGVYVSLLEADGFVATRKLTLMK